MTLPAAVMPSCAVAGAIALVLAIMSIRWGGWGGWTLGILLALIALAGIGMAAFLAWGHYTGFSWHFA